MTTNDWNAQIVEEFRANAGRVGGPFAGAPILLLHTRGARSGAERVHPMMYQKVGDAYAVFASKAGAPNDPAWFHNLVAHPEVEAEIGGERVRLCARVTSGAERSAIWEHQKTLYPVFAGYEAKTERAIPVIVLEPTPATNGPDGGSDA